MTEVDEIAYDIKLEEGKCITEELRRAGFYVFRFTEEEVLTNIQGVAMEIEGIIQDIAPSPAPRQRGTETTRLGEKTFSFCTSANGGQKQPDVGHLIKRG